MRGTRERGECRVREDQSVACRYKGCPAVAVYSAWDETSWPSRYVGDVCSRHAWHALPGALARGHKVTLRRIA